MTNSIKLRCSGRVDTLTFDVAAMMGDTLDELETHLDGQSVLVWLQALVAAFEHGFRVRDFRTRDLIAMVFLARAQAEPGTTWSDVAKSIAPYTLEIVDDDQPRAESMAVATDLGEAVPEPASLSPVLSALRSPGAHEAPPAPTGADLYRTS